MLGISIGVFFRKKIRVVEVVLDIIKINEVNMIVLVFLLSNDDMR